MKPVSSYHGLDRNIPRLRLSKALHLALCFAIWSGAPALLAADIATNLALSARATAFEFQPGLPAELGNDGKMDTRWSGIPGHNTGGWYELTWNRPVRVGQIVVHQYDRYVKEMDVQAWDDEAKAWITLQHFGQPDRRLPKVVVCRFKPRVAARVRLASITNGPSFNEVQVFEESFAIAPAINLASDANGNFIGMISDAWGSEPVKGAPVKLSGQTKRGPWQVSAQSDEHGLFFAPMTLGATGQVTVVAEMAESGAATHTERFDAAGFQYGLTPLPLKSQKTSLAGRWRFATDPPAHFWEPGFDDRRWAEIKVPAHFEMEGFRSVDGVGGYRKRFQAPRGSGRMKLRFDGVYSGAEVWVNGQRLAYHEGGALPFEVDVTEAVHGGENLLAVRVTEHTPVSNLLDKMSEYADFPLAGIFRDVYLFRVPPIHAGAIQYATIFDAAFRDATITGRAAIVNESSRPLANGSLTLRLVDARGKTVAADVRRLILPNERASGSSSSLLTSAATPKRPLPVRVGPWERAEVEFSLPVSAPRKWDAEHPNLYTLTVELREGPRVIEELTQRMGFRQTDIRDGQLLINGQPVKIRGTCHHDSHPLLGRAVTPELERQDLQLMKEANLNSLRTSHYPPIPELLDVADELGLYVEAEGSFCWVNVADDLRYTPRIMQLNAELLSRDRNHPSIFVWSICNESAFGSGFVRSHEWLRAADPTRPHAGSWDPGHVEFHAQHNPITIADINKLEQQSRPVLWDECWCIFQGIWGDIAEMWLDPGIRDCYAAPLPPIYARMMESKRIAGTQIWAWSDDIFCVPNRGLEYGRDFTRCHFIENQYRLPHRGLVGDAPWGVVDGWRRKKPEFWITKKLHSPVKLKEAPIPLPAAGQLIKLAVENQYDFTDLSELRIEWQLGKEKGVAKAAVPPHSVGELELKLPRAPQTGEILALQFLDPRGAKVGLVDTYRLPLGQKSYTVGRPEGVAQISNLLYRGFPIRKSIQRRSTSRLEVGDTADWKSALQTPQPAPLRIFQESILAGRSTHLVGRDFELAFDHASGSLRRAVAFGEALLLDLPALHVLPSDSPMSPLPKQASWRLRKLTVEPEQDNVRVRVQGTYDHFEGGYDLLITPSGEITAHSSFRYTGDKLLAREIGWVLALPKECDRLRWSREAEWSVYPDDHIGRPEGETRAFADHPADLPPTWSWVQDNSPMGCNDFRSTKRHIRWASLGYADGPAVLVISDGSQSVRATVESDRIAFHINDWYGGTHVGLWEWTSNYGEGKPITAGQTIESTVQLQLAAPGN